MKGKPRFILLPLIGILKENSLWLEGQVLHLRRHHREIVAGESKWKNMIRVISAYMPGNIKTGMLEVNLPGDGKTLTVTQNGFYTLQIDRLKFKNANLRPDYFFLRKNMRYPVQIPEFYNREIYYFNGFRAGVISDIDDTILVSHVTNHLKRFRHLLTKNAFRRKAVSRMASVYQQLAGMDMNMFYVSNSEANLFPVIHTFLKHHQFPDGPLFLKPYKEWNDLLKRKKKKSYSKHKKEKILSILNLFHEKKFFLIGDDSQKDPEVYSDIAKKFPGRIGGIFIRKTGKRVKANTRKMMLDFAGNKVIHALCFEDPEEILKYL